MFTSWNKYINIKNWKEIKLMWIKWYRLNLKIKQRNRIVNRSIKKLFNRIRRIIITNIKWHELIEFLILKW